MEPGGLEGWRAEQAQKQTNGILVSLQNWNWQDHGLEGLFWHIESVGLNVGYLGTFRGLLTYELVACIVVVGGVSLQREIIIGAMSLLCLSDFSMEK